MNRPIKNLSFNGNLYVGIIIMFIIFAIVKGDYDNPFRLLVGFFLVIGVFIDYMWLTGNQWKPLMTKLRNTINDLINNECKK